MNVRPVATSTGSTAGPAGDVETPLAGSDIDRDSPLGVAVAGAPTLTEPVLTKNELGPNSSSDSESRPA